MKPCVFQGVLETVAVLYMCSIYYARVLQYGTCVLVSDIIWTFIL